MINEIDQGLDVLSMEAITVDSEDEETKPTKPISQENQKKDDNAAVSLEINLQVACEKFGTLLSLKVQAGPQKVL